MFTSRTADDISIQCKLVPNIMVFKFFRVQLFNRDMYIYMYMYIFRASSACLVTHTHAPTCAHVRAREMDYELTADLLTDKFTNVKCFENNILWKFPSKSYVNWLTKIHNSLGNTMSVSEVSDTDQYDDQVLGPSKEPSGETNWGTCVICQTVTREALQCPGETARQCVGDGYSTLAENLVHFNELQEMPIEIDVQKLDEGME